MHVLVSQKQNLELNPFPDGQPVMIFDQPVNFLFEIILKVIFQFPGFVLFHRIIPCDLVNKDTIQYNWKGLAVSYQMTTHLPGFLSFSTFFAQFSIDHSATSITRVKMSKNFFSYCAFLNIQIQVY